MSETPIGGQPPNPTCISLKLQSSNTPKQARHAGCKIEVRGEGMICHYKSWLHNTPAHLHLLPSIEAEKFFELNADLQNLQNKVKCLNFK